MSEIPATVAELHDWLNVHGVNIEPHFAGKFVVRYTCENIDLVQLLDGIRELTATPPADGFAERLRQRVNALVLETFQDAASEVTKAVIPG